MLISAINVGRTCLNVLQLNTSPLNLLITKPVIAQVPNALDLFGDLLDQVCIDVLRFACSQELFLDDITLRVFKDTGVTSGYTAALDQAQSYHC
jgi:hypothetical protein